MKISVRKKLRQSRKIHGFREKKRKDKKICSTLEKLELFKKAKNLLFYAPIKEEGEVDTWLLIKKYIQKREILLPRSNQAQKIFTACHIKKMSDLVKKNKKIKEPQVHCKKIDPAKIDLIIIPGIAFDKKGYRIGFGHGFYDRFLKKVKCPVIGLAYEFQIVQSIRRESHDVPVDLIITEKEIITCS